jgi:26S proteasome regulatory subunit N2
MPGTKSQTTSLKCKKLIKYRLNQLFFSEAYVDDASFP